MSSILRLQMLIQKLKKMTDEDLQKTSEERIKYHPDNHICIDREIERRSEIRKRAMEDRRDDRENEMLKISKRASMRSWIALVISVPAGLVGIISIILFVVKGCGSGK